jgi:hypothetical protein
VITAAVAYDPEPNMILRMNWATDSVITESITAMSICIGEGESLLGVGLSDWTEVDPDLSTITGDLVLTSQGSAYCNIDPIDLTEDWSMTATLQLVAGAMSHDIAVGVGNISATIRFGFNLWDDDGGYLYANGFDYFYIPNGAWAEDTDIFISFFWDADAMMLHGTARQGSRIEVCQVLVETTLGAFDHYPVIAAAGNISDTSGLLVTSITLQVES